MATTHVILGVAVATLSFVFAPEYAVVAAIAGGAGGLFPDLDLYKGHRKTLHFPVYYSAAAFPALGIAVIYPTPWTVGSAFFIAGAAVHASLDVFGGGLELRPWRATSDRAVYDHFHQRWLAPKRLVRYDGAPEDLGLAVLLGGPIIVLHDPPVTSLVLFALGISIGYVLLRRRLADLAATIARVLPSQLTPYVPARYRDTSLD